MGQHGATYTSLALQCADLLNSYEIDCDAEEQSYALGLGLGFGLVSSVTLPGLTATLALLYLSMWPGTTNQKELLGYNSAQCISPYLIVFILLYLKIKSLSTLDLQTH